MNLVPMDRRRVKTEGAVADSTGRMQQIVAYLECEATLDSVSGRYRYSYALESDPQSRARLLYFAMYPVESTTAYDANEGSVSAGGSSTRMWFPFRWCSSHIDVFGWMARNGDSSADARASGLRPGEVLRGCSFEASNPPEAGRWIAGGGRGCGPACFPWADSCNLGTPLAGSSFMPGCGNYAHGSLRGEVSESRAPVPGAQVAVLGAGRAVTAEANGSYLFMDLPPGRFRVRATAPGFDPAESWVDIGMSAAFCNLRMTRSRSK